LHDSDFSFHLEFHFIFSLPLPDDTFGAGDDEDLASGRKYLSLRQALQGAPLYLQCTSPAIEKKVAFFQSGGYNAVCHYTNTSETEFQGHALQIFFSGCRRRSRRPGRRLRMD
jgi:hypothetical protein